MRWRVGWLVGALALVACGVAPATPIPARVVAQERAIPGLTADAVLGAMRARGFACGGQERGPDGAARWICRSSGPASLFEVAAWGEEPARITRVEAAALLDRPNDDVAADVLGVVAGALPYAGAEPPRARSWATQGVRQGAATATTIGGARLELVGPPTARMLRVTPAP